jgi:hypothetical protein
VGRNAYFDVPVRWLLDAEITTGIGTPSRYEPTRATTRAQVVAFLWRLAGRPTFDGDLPFDDVPSGAFFEAAVGWAAANNITNGKRPGKFDPDLPVTRAEMVTFLQRAADVVYPPSDLCPQGAGDGPTTAVC